MLSNRLTKHFAAAAAVTVVAGSANAAIVHWSNINLVVPNTIDGLYINVETQTTGSAAGVVPGWDINPYGTSTTAMSWFGATGGGCVTGLGQGGTSTAVASLSSGTLVSGASTFANTASSVTAGGWVLNANNYFGFRFVAADGATKYGWGTMAIGANMGTRTLVEIAFESDAGVGISVGTVPAPGAIALLGLAGLAGRRRR
jgi:MYXO-CTERM domain-containing protein